MDQTLENSKENQHNKYLATIKSLKKLQNIDDKIHETTNELEQKPKLLQENEAELTRKKKEVDSYSERHDFLTNKEKSLHAEIDERNERLRKSKDKLMETTNEREYNATSREIDSQEKNSLPLENELVSVLEEKERVESRLKEILPEYLAKKAQVEAMRTNIETEMAELQSRLDEFALEREESVRNVTKPVLERYEFIRERLEHPVIVSLSDAICPSCHIALPPQAFNELLQGIKIANCPSCQRIIVWHDDYIADDPEAQQEAARQREQEKPAKKPSMGRSAALDKGDYKEEKEDVEFGPAGEEEDEDRTMDTIGFKLDSMSSMADVSDLPDMAVTDLDDLNDDSEENERDK